MIGGRSSHQDYDDVWSLNLDSLQWTKHPKLTLPKATSFLAADCTKDGQLSIFGGVYNSLHPQEAQRLNTINEIWIKIPSLKRLATEAVMNNYSQLGGYRNSSKPIKFLMKKVKDENVKTIFRLPEH